MYTMELTPEQIEMNDVPEFPAMPDRYLNKNANKYKVYGKERHGSYKELRVIGIVSLFTSQDLYGKSVYSSEYVHTTDGIKIEIPMDGESLTMEFCEDLIRQGATFEKM